ncbi:RNA-directed DNA polymerase, eukaryota, reverse transcriptase zinc-binding domain protein, partial [Tanacetum coccineum]
MERSRRTVKILIKFGDMICGLNKKKNDQQNTRNLEESVRCDIEVDYGETRGTMDGNVKVMSHNPKLKGISKRLDSDNDVNNSELNVNNVHKPLNMIPTGMNDGRDVVFFKDELVMEESKKWELTLCGYFVRDEIRLNRMLESGPWMIRSKPLLVQRWEHSLIIDKKEPNVLPIWIKLLNLPLEAWTMKGIRGVASSRLGYARVLMEINAKNDFKDNVEICYKNQSNIIYSQKFINVEYAWKPPKCSHCHVFGHNHANFNKNRDVFGYKYQKQNVIRGDGDARKDNKKKSYKEFRLKVVQNEANINGNTHNVDNLNKGKAGSKSKEATSPRESWNVPNSVTKELIKSANKYFKDKWESNYGFGIENEKNILEVESVIAQSMTVQEM